MEIRTDRGASASLGRSAMPTRGNPIVPVIQKLFPPAEQLPQPQPPSRKPPEDSPRGLDQITRAGIPDWLEPGNGLLIPANGELVIEGDCPLLARCPLGSVAPEGEIERKCPNCPALKKGRLESVDLLAYYLPFHFYTNNWGIYVLSSGILRVAAMLAIKTGQVVSSELANLGYAILIQHERFHFFSEMACSRAELLIDGSLYRSYFHNGIATAYEEALANAHAFRTTLRGQPAALARDVEQWMSSQGPGYRDFKKCLTSSAFRDWCRQLTRLMRSAAPLGIFADKSGVKIRASGASATLPTEFLYHGLARSAVPVRLLVDVPCLGIVKPFPKL